MENNRGIIIIKTEAQYKKIMSQILPLMNKGEGNLTKAETVQLREMALAAQAYEKNIFSIPPPQNIEGIIELK